MPLPSLPETLFSREFLRIGGGYNAPAAGASPAGGLEVDHAGNLATNGSLITAADLSVAQDAQFTGRIVLPIQDRTLDSGAITINGAFVRVAAESGTSDDLETIHGGSTGCLLILRPTGSHTITLKHGVGNLVCPGNTDLVLQFRRVILLFDASAWNVLSVQG